MRQVELKQVKGEDTCELIIRAEDTNGIREAWRLIHTVNLLEDLEQRFTRRLEESQNGNLVGLAITLDPPAEDTE